MRRAYDYRLYPNRAQGRLLEETLETHRRLYNQALAARKTAWEDHQVAVSYGQQSGQLKGERQTNAFLARTNFSSCQATLRRLDRAYQAFFRRVKNGETPGYPRFKGRGRFDSVEYPAYGDGCWFKPCAFVERPKQVADGTLLKPEGTARAYFQLIGRIKVLQHRPLPADAVVKTMTLKRRADGWYVLLSCELPDPVVQPSTKPDVGMDLGLKDFLITSDDHRVPNPRCFRQSQQQLRVAQRKLARRQKGSTRRGKAKVLVARQHLHVARQRKDFHRKTANALVAQYGTIAHEQLNVSGLAKGMLAKAVHDVAWSAFLETLRHKAAEAGVAMIGVPARHSSQECAVCGTVLAVPLTLKARTFVCHNPGCPNQGQPIDRDLNAARVIRTRGQQLRNEPTAIAVGMGQARGRRRPAVVKTHPGPGSGLQARTSAVAGVV